MAAPQAFGGPIDGARDRDRGGPPADLSSAVYGSLLVTTLVAAQARHDASVDFITFTLLVSVAVFWLMEVWSQLVNMRVRGPITVAEGARVAWDRSPMLAAAVLPAIALLTVHLDVTTVDQAVALALVVCVVQLFLWGLAVGLAIGRGWAVALVVAAVDCALGSLIVALKVLIVH